MQFDGRARECCARGVLPRRVLLLEPTPTTDTPTSSPQYSLPECATVTPPSRVHGAREYKAAWSSQATHRTAPRRKTSFSVQPRTRNATEMKAQTIALHIPSPSPKSCTAAPPYQRNTRHFTPTSSDLAHLHPTPWHPTPPYSSPEPLWDVKCPPLPPLLSEIEITWWLGSFWSSAARLQKRRHDKDDLSWYAESSSRWLELRGTERAAETPRRCSLPKKTPFSLNSPSPMPHLARHSSLPEHAHTTPVHRHSAQTTPDPHSHFETVSKTS